MYIDSMPPRPPAHYLATELNALLQKDNSTWEFLQHGSLDGVWYWDLESPETEWMSPEFWHLLGIDPATKAHSPEAWQDLIHPDDLKLALENFERHCADPDHPYDQIVRYRHADGSTVWVRCRGIAIRDETGKPVRMLGAHNDLTAVKRGEAAAVEQKKELERINGELRAFAYGISHDLKAPTNTAKMLLREIRESGGYAPNAEQAELFDYAQGTLDRMCDMIENVLGYARLVGAAPDTERLDMTRLVNDVVRDLRARIEEAGGTVEVGDLPPLHGNPIQLRSLFQNLIENALKFRREGVPPVVRVRGWEINGERRYEVADNGIGIEEKYHKTIFLMFARLHNHDDYIGAGLGLAACAKVAANHGGEISVTSQLGRGSAFHVTLNGQDMA